MAALVKNNQSGSAELGSADKDTYFCHRGREESLGHLADPPLGYSVLGELVLTFFNILPIEIV